MGLRVLVAEKIGASGVALLREHFDVDEGDHLDRIAEYDGILIRSATKLTADVLAKATRLKAIGRAGVGVDNVDVAAATKRGIVVANAPQSNVVTAAEHTMALLLALARNVPAGAREPDRGQVGALEVLRRRAARQDARHPRLRAHRPARRPPRAGLRHARDRLRPVRRPPSATASSACEKAESLRRRLRAGRLPHAAPAQDARDRGLARRRGAGQVQGRRAHPQRRARPARSSTRTSRRRSTPARSAALRSTSSAPSRSPSTRCSGAPTSSSRRTSAPRPPRRPIAPASRPPSRSSPRSPAASSHSAVNVPAVAAEDMEVLGPFLPLSRRLGRLAMGLAAGLERRSRRGRAARPHRRPRHAAAGRSRSCSAP